ncbi:MAG: DUF3822 family protein [Cyclobacteriaceae bacterium]|nr:DUF3822 family protein [Cyclobacteriaceae bacterium]
MQLTATPYRLLKKIRDEQFEEDHIAEYHLALLTGPHDLQVLVYNPVTRRALWMEDYVFPSSTSDDDWLSALQEVFDQHPFLTAGFWKKIIAGVKTPSFVQTPAALFDDAQASQYLQYNASVRPGEDILYFSQDGHGLVTSFAFPAAIKNWLLSVYASNHPVFTHQSCSLMEGVLHEARQQHDNPLYIYVDRFRLHILSAQPEGLRYYNQFFINNFSDYIRYIMLVMHTLGMNQQTGKVILWGYVGKNSPHYQEFYKYIQSITYGGRPGFLHFSYLFDEIQEHQYFDVWNMARLTLPS